jgi:hypothetical protein
LGLRVHWHGGDHENGSNQLRIHGGLQDLYRLHDAIWSQLNPGKTFL